MRGREGNVPKSTGNNTGGSNLFALEALEGTDGLEVFFLFLGLFDELLLRFLFDFLIEGARCDQLRVKAHNLPEEGEARQHDHESQEQPAREERRFGQQRQKSW